MALGSEDKDELRSRIGLGSALLATTSAELFMCNIRKNAKFIKDVGVSKSKGKWVDAGIKGALCFVCDSDGCFHFMIFRKRDFSEIFSASLAFSTKLKKISDNFACYESEEGMVGFHIDDSKEASTFFNVVSDRLPSKTLKKKIPKKSSKLGFSFFRKVISKKNSRSSQLSLTSKRKEKPFYSTEGLSPQWKTFFKENGVRKKDFLKLEVQSKIRNALEEQNISLVPPPNMSLEQAKKIYKNKKEYEKYKKYSIEQEKYEKDMKRYLNEIRLFNQKLTVIPKTQEKVNLFQTSREQRQANLPKPILPPRRKPPQFPVLPPVSKDELEQAVDDFFNDELFESKSKRGEVKPFEIEEDEEEEVEEEVEDDHQPQITENKPSFCDMLVNKKLELKPPPPALPDIGTLTAEERAPLLEIVRQKLESRRTFVTVDDSSESGSEWSIE